MRRILEWLGHFNTITGIAILFGVPVSLFTGIGSAIWWRFDHLRWSYIAVLMLAVFGLTLWSWIGLIWLFDRAKNAKPPVVKRDLNCEWGLAVDGAFLNFDAVSPIACQITLVLRNLLSWPLRIEIIQQAASVDAVTPNKQVDMSPPVVIPQGGTVTLSFDGYSQGTIPSKLNYSGKIEFRLKYGHPGIGMTRKMGRFYNFVLNLQPHPFQAMIAQHAPPGSPPPVAPPVLGSFPLPLTNASQDEDEPI